jgi:hypothetical protein
MLLEPAKKGTLKKPVVVVVITDGVPYPERPSKIVDVIKDANKKLSKTKYGADAVSYRESDSDVSADTRICSTRQGQQCSTVPRLARQPPRDWRPHRFNLVL